MTDREREQKNEERERESNGRWADIYRQIDNKIYTQIYRKGW